MKDINKAQPKVTITLTHILDNDFWGIEEMLKNGELSINNVRELIKEDYSILIKDGKLDICIELVEVSDE